ncbi:MAG TPA: DUF402 domain-containing protein [Micromonosporaceae bacterium]
MKFAPGEVLVRRHWRGGRVNLLELVRVAADDERGLRLWLPAGSPYWRLVGPDDDADHEPTDDSRTARLVRHMWTGTDVLIWLPEDRAYSVTWLWADGTFAGWRARLEEPYVRWADRGCAGVDTADQSLEVAVRPDRSWRLRDEDEFRARTGHPLYWTQAQAVQIRGTAERLTRLAEAAQFPFDGTWCGFRPDASWTVPALPHGYDRPRALHPGRDAAPARNRA